MLFGEVGNTAVTEDIIHVEWSLGRLLCWWLLLILLLIWIAAKNVKQIVCGRTLIFIIRMEAWDWPSILIVATRIGCLVLIRLIWHDLLRPAVIEVKGFHICPVIIVVAIVWLIVVLIRTRLVVIITLVVLILAAITIACQRIIISFLVVLVVWILRLIWSSSIWVVVDGLHLLCRR